MKMFSIQKKIREDNFNKSFFFLRKTAIAAFIKTIRFFSCFSLFS